MHWSRTLSTMRIAVFSMIKLHSIVLCIALCLVSTKLWAQNTVQNDEFWPPSTQNQAENTDTTPANDPNVQQNTDTNVKNAANVPFSSNAVDENSGIEQTQIDLANPEDKSANPNSVSAADNSDSLAPQNSVIALSEPKIIAIEPEQKEDQSFKNYIADRFRFGSYGRVQPSINPATGESGRQTSLVYPSPRVDEASYLELTLAYVPYRDENDVEVEVVSTLAFGGEKLFHFDNDFDAKIAVRNLYVEARNLFFDGSVLWAGSRMYRGDDIYLLDFWPLDNLNTYGGGVGWHGSTRTNVDLHFGVNRLNNDYQYQVVDVINERFVGEQEVVFLDRQRFIASLKVEQLFGNTDSALYKIKAYAEIHALGKGKLLLTQLELQKDLPADNGWLIGAQFGVSNFYNDSFLNLFVKYSRGLAAYGELAIPFGLDKDMKAAKASQFLLGLSGGIDTKYLAILFGGYLRYFKDADGQTQDYDDGWEGVWDLRFTGLIGKYFAPSIELSQQLRRPNGTNPVSLKQELASIFKLSLLPAVRFGSGLLARPELRLNYSVSFLNGAANRVFAPRDRLRERKIEHYLGFAAEWWFNI